MNPKLIAQRLNATAAHFEQLAQEKALSAVHKAGPARILNELDARLIRDHEIRAETFKAAIEILTGHE